MRRVLIVEDHPDVRFMLRVALEMAGLTVLEAPDGATAITLALAHRPPCVIVDFGLPDIDGCTVATRIRAGAQKGAVYLIALTGFDEGSDRDRAEAAGFDAYLVKPVAPDVLVALVVKALG